VKQCGLFSNDLMVADRSHKPVQFKAPFPYFGGKTSVADLIWYAFGDPKHYIEPFLGSAAVLLAAPRPASLEVVGDVNLYVANFWRAVKYQPDLTWEETDYPVSHLDMAARHAWLMEPARVQALADRLADPEWPGDARIAGWWCWGQCAWIGHGWCTPSWVRSTKIPHVTGPGKGVQSMGEVNGSHRARVGKVPHTTDPGQKVLSPAADGRTWMRSLSERLARVRLIHGDWTRTLNHHYGGDETAVFFDPPYAEHERVYGGQRGAESLERSRNKDGTYMKVEKDVEPVAHEVAAWCRKHAHLRIALCGNDGDYNLPGWQVVRWDRRRLSYGGRKTTARETIWFSPACRRVK
jgi:DNA adenine methylase